MDKVQTHATIDNQIALDTSRDEAKQLKGHTKEETLSVGSDAEEECQGLNPEKSKAPV